MIGTKAEGSAAYSFQLFLLVTLFTLIIFYTSNTLIPLYVLELGGNSFHSGLQNAVFFLGAVVLRFYFGPLGDARGRKLPLLIGIFVFATSPIVFWFCQNVFHVILARFYQAIGLAAFFSTGNSLIADFAPPHKLGVYVALNRMMYTLALLTGPWLGQSVVDGWGYGTWFRVAALIGGLALILMFIVRTPPVPLKSGSNYLGMTWEALKVKHYRPILAHVAVVSAVYGIFMTFIPIYVRQEAGLANPGVYFTCFGLAGIATNLISGYLSDLWGRKAIVVPAIAAMVLGLVLLFRPDYGLPLLLTSAVICGIAYAGGMAALAAWLVDVIDPKMRATALALYDNSIDLSVAAGSFLVGVLNQWLPLFKVFPLMGFVILVYLVVAQKRECMEKIS